VVEAVAPPASCRGMRHASRGADAWSLRSARAAHHERCHVVVLGGFAQRAHQVGE
jgi:hypothetical protein